jgi:hypothetical protein
MSKAERPVTIWLLIVALLIAAMVVVGGYVRLTRSGLSIVEWNPVTGVIPPLGDAAWQQEFAKYQQTPEYKIVNREMTLAGYQRIFYLEWAHRLIARIAGLVVVLPLAWFLWRGAILWRASAPYLLIGLLFGLQGFLGWWMVGQRAAGRAAGKPLSPDDSPVDRAAAAGADPLAGLQPYLRANRAALAAVVGARRAHAGGDRGADRLRRAGGGSQGRPHFQHLAADVWGVGSRRHVDGARFLAAERGRRAGDGALHPPLAGLWRAGRGALALALAPSARRSQQRGRPSGWRPSSWCRSAWASAW